MRFRAPSVVFFLNRRVPCDRGLAFGIDDTVLVFARLSGCSRGFLPGVAGERDGQAFERRGLLVRLRFRVDGAAGDASPFRGRFRDRLHSAGVRGPRLQRSRRWLHTRRQAVWADTPQNS